MSYDEKSIHIEMRMYNQSGEKLKSVFWAKFFYIDISTGKLAQHPEDLMELFEKVRVPQEQKHFEHWIQKMRA